MATATKAAPASRPARTAIPTPIFRKQNPSTLAQPLVNLSKTLVYRELALELTGQLAVVGASNTPANTGIGDEWAALQNIQIQVNGSDVLRNFSGDDLFNMNVFWYKQVPQVTAAIGDGATLNPSFDSNLIIPFWIPDAFHPFDTLLDGGRFNYVQFIPTYAPATAVNSAATGYQTAPQVNLVSHEQVLPQDPSDQPKLNWVVKKYQNLVTGANPSFRVPLDAGVSYRGFIINIKNSAGTADAGSTAFATTPQSLVSNVKVVGAGSRVYHDHPWTEVAFNSKIRRRVPLTVTRRSTSSNFGAWANIDLCTDGRLGESMPNPADAYLEFNVGGACQINVLAQIIFPIGNG